MAITLTGENSFSLNHELKDLETKFTLQYGDLALEQIDAEDSDIEHIFSAIYNQPLLSERKMVVIRGFTNSKDLLSSLETIIERTPDSNQLVMVSAKIDKRANYYKQLKKLTDFREFPLTNSNDLVNWLVKEATIRQGSIDLASARLLVEYSGLNQLKLSNELDKLLLYNSTINKASISLLCEKEPSSSVFELLDAAFRGDSKKAISLYELQRRQRVEPLAILSMIAWQLNILAIVKSAGSKSADVIGRDASMHSFAVQKAVSVTNSLSKVQLKELISRALKIDLSLKSQTINADDAMKYLLLSIQYGH